MIEAALSIWIVLIGVVGASFAAKHLGVWGLAFTAPIIGVAFYVMGGLVLLAFGAFGTVEALLVASVMAVAGVVASRWATGRWPIPGSAGAAAGIGLVGTAAASVFVQSANPTRLTMDAMDHLAMAGSLERFGEMIRFIPDLLLKRQVVVGMLQAPGVITGLGYSPTLILVYSVSAIALLGWLGNRALQAIGVPAKARLWIVGAAAVFVVTTNRVIYNSFYINGHSLFGALMLIGVGFAWYAAVTGRWPLVVLSSVAFVTLVPLRADAVALAALFILPLIASERLPVWSKWTVVAPFLFVTTVWYGVILAPYLPAAEYRPTGTAIVNIIVAVGLVGVVAAGRFPLLRLLVRMSPWLALGVLAAFVAMRASHGFSVVLKSLGSTGSNIGAYGLWSSFWWVAPILAVAALIAVVVPHQRMLVFGLLSFPIALLAFAYLRGSPYRVGAGDSANRMLMHVAHVLVLYIIVAAGVAYRQIADGVDGQQAIEAVSAASE